jgi:hypothetical protein
MEVVSGSRAHHLTPPRWGAGLAMVLLGACLLLPFAAAAETDVIGTWHVLVHYKDDNATHPERERWDDRVWVFEKSGSRIRWTEYPIVVFDDQVGRFDSSMGRSARVLEFWTPNAGQIADIKDGLSVNERGMKSKSLRKADDGWASFSRASAASASVIGYTEYWSIDNGADGPVFKREDVLGSERSENLDGVTLYTTQNIESNVLRGQFERDGTRHGTFQMMRTAGTEGLKSDGKTPNEKANDRGQQALEALGYGVE